MNNTEPPHRQAQAVRHHRSPLGCLLSIGCALIGLLFSAPFACGILSLAVFIASQVIPHLIH